MTDPRQWGLRQEWACTCGVLLLPDCDISWASVADAFEAHLIETHGCTVEEIEAALSDVH